MKTICLIGTFDTKGSEYAFVRDQLLARGQKVLAVNTGVLGSINLFPVDVEADQVARAGNSELAELRRNKDRRGQNGVSPIFLVFLISSIKPPPRRLRR